MTAHLEVLLPGPLATIQDRGRPGRRHFGVSPSGAADRGAHARANALVGNPEGAAAIEVTLGGLGLRAHGSVVLALTGAACAGARMDCPLRLADGAVLRLATPSEGLRTYVAVRGGIEVAAVLGSRSTDTLSGLGPPPLRQGDLLEVGGAGVDGDQPAGTGGGGGEDAGGVAPTGGGAAGTHGGVRTRPAGAGDRGTPTLSVLPGPRDDWLPAAAWAGLAATRWTVSPQSNRVAVRLEGEALPVRRASLPPEPLVRGAVQVPPDGRPIIFLADHPVTGGYPVIGVLTPGGCDALAQLRPGRMTTLTAAARSGRWA